MLSFGKELLSTMVKSMVKSNIKERPTISKLTVRNKKLLLTLDSHMPQPLFNLIPQPSMQVMTKNFHTSMVVVTTTQEPQRWTQMPPSGKELLSMMVRYMERNNTKRTPTISKPTVKPKKLLLTPESHMPQLSSDLILQLDMLVMTRSFHILMERATTTQEHQRWTQMPPSGREELSMMERFTEKSNIKRMPTTSKHTVKPKRLLLTPESHMHQLSSKLRVAHQSQVLHLFQILESHILKELSTTQVPQPWTQMPSSGKEEPSMMERFTVKSNTKRMLTTSKPTVRNKRLLPIPDSHMLQL